VSRVEKFPHPGAAPPEPGTKPEYDHERDHLWNDVTYRAWVTAKTVHETYIIRLRKHTIAAALDEMRGLVVQPAERIIKALGEEFLANCEPRP